MKRITPIVKIGIRPTFDGSAVECVIAEGWSLDLPEEVDDTLSERTNELRRPSGLCHV